MKSKLALLMALMLLASMVPIFPAISSPAEEIFMTPSVNPPATPSIGYTWDVYVWIKEYNNPNVWAWQVMFIIDPVASGINITGARNPTTDSRYIFYGRPIVNPEPSFYDTTPHDGLVEAVKIGDSLLASPAETPPPEPALLCIITLNITRAPGKYETLSTALNINNPDTYVLDEDLNDRYPIRTDGTYSWTWQPPSVNPDVAIRPNSKIFDQYTNWMNFIFTVDVMIENLDIGWALHNAQIGITYNSPDAILEIVSVTVDSAWAGPNTVDYSTPGEISIFVQGHPAPAGNVKVATIAFKIIHQGMNPPQTAPDVSDLTLHDVTLMDTVGPITINKLIHGEVKVYPLLVLPLPWFEVNPWNTTLGPDLVVGDQYGKTFTVNIELKGLHGTWRAIGWNIRVTFDPELLEIVEITEGSLWKDPRWNRYGTYFISGVDAPNPYCPDWNIYLGNLLMPAPDGEWYRYPGLWNEQITVRNASKVIEPEHVISGQNWTEIAGSMLPGTLYTQVDYSDVDWDGLYSIGDKIQLMEVAHGWTEWYTVNDVVRYPDGSVDLLLAQEPTLASGVIASITFKVLKQSWIEDYTANLDIYPLFPPIDYIIDKDFNEIPVDEGKIKNGIVTVKAIEATGRRIDVWFVNPPNGGQGLGTPADLVLPQTEITLTAKVTYNWWPVQYKKVTFEVRDNHGALWAVLQDDTDDEGHAYVTFRMPWPCHGAEDLIGKWNVTVSVTLADVVITDYVAFDYDYLIHIWKVTTDKAEYQHCETVKITVSYGTKVMHEVTVVLAVTVTDELGVPIGVVLTTVKVGPAPYCTYKNYTTTVSIHIDKWAYAGLATVHASFLWALPSQGGEAVAQERTTTFYILPY